MESHQDINNSTPGQCAKPGCMFHGRPETDNFCSVCFKEQIKNKQQQAETSQPAVAPAVAQTPAPVLQTKPVEEVKTVEVSTLEVTETPQKKKPTRCGVCKKKVGLTGFKCRCEGIYCGLHRYSDKHECSFDYKAMGREEVAANNPKVIADKLNRI
eukprot:Clim_evm42s6 gene=Clim_evmTU42s6